MEHDCDRYALKREVAAEIRRFFRGVCPILNRAINIWMCRIRTGLRALAISRRFYAYPRIFQLKRESGFFMPDGETPGAVYAN